MPVLIVWFTILYKQAVLCNSTTLVYQGLLSIVFLYAT